MNYSPEYIAQLEQSLEKARSREKRRDIALMLAENLINSRPIKAAEYADITRTLAEVELNKSGINANAIKTNQLAIARAQTVIFFCKQSSAERDELVPMIQSAIDCFEKYSDAIRVAKARQKLAFYHFRSRRFEEARRLYEIDLNVLIKAEEISAIVSTRNGLGQILIHEGKHDLAIEQFRDGLGWAMKLGEPVYIIAMHVGMGMAYQDHGQFALARESYESALQYCDEDLMLQQSASIHIGLAGLENMRGDYVSSINHCMIALHHYERAGDFHGMSSALEVASGAYMTLSDFEHAIKLIQRLELIARETGSPFKQAAANNLLATAYASQKDHEKALLYFQEAQRLFDLVSDQRGQCYSRANVAQTLNDLGRAHEAEALVRSALHMSREFVFPDLEVEILPIYCAIALNVGFAADIVSDLEHGIQSSIRIDFKRGQGLILKCLSDVAFAFRDLQNAHQKAQEAAQIAREVGDRVLEAQCLQRIAELYAAASDFKTAYEFHRQFHTLDAENNRAAAERNVRNMMVLLETERLQKERDILQQQNTHLQSQNEYKQKELSAMALHLVHKNEMLESIKHRAQNIVSEYSSEARSLADEMVRQIERNLRDDTSWESFNQQFTQLHSNFVQSLSERYPKLTPMELKICSLLKIQLSTKEIAAALVLSPRTVEDHRNRLRRKFKLSKDHNLATFLSAIG